MTDDAKNIGKAINQLMVAEHTAKDFAYDCPDDAMKSALLEASRALSRIGNLCPTPEKLETAAAEIATHRQHRLERENNEIIDLDGRREEKARLLEEANKKIELILKQQYVAEQLADDYWQDPALSSAFRHAAKMIGKLRETMDKVASMEASEEDRAADVLRL